MAADEQFIITQLERLSLENIESNEGLFVQGQDSSGIEEDCFVDTDGNDAKKLKFDRGNDKGKSPTHDGIPLQFKPLSDEDTQKIDMPTSHKPVERSEHSLVTDERVDTILCQLENAYAEQRKLPAENNGFIPTPLHAVQELTKQFGGLLYNQVYSISVGTGEKLYHAELIAGTVKGVGEARFSKGMAVQMAALDILQKVKDFLPTHQANVPFYALPPGWRVKPCVCPSLLKVCREMGLQNPKFISTMNKNRPNLPLYTVECRISDRTVGLGTSDIPFVARKIAAQYAYFEVTGKPYQLEYAAMGPTSLSMKQLEQVERTINHTQNKCRDDKKAEDTVSIRETHNGDGDVNVHAENRGKIFHEETNAVVTFITKQRSRSAPSSTGRQKKRKLLGRNERCA